MKIKDIGEGNIIWNWLKERFCDYFDIFILNLKNVKKTEWNWKRNEKKIEGKHKKDIFYLEVMKLEWT